MTLTIKTYEALSFLHVNLRTHDIPNNEGKLCRDQNH